VSSIHYQQVLIEIKEINMNDNNLNKNKLSLTLAATLFGASPVALADAPLAQSGMTLNPGVGYYSFDDDTALDDEAFPSLGLEYRFDNNIAVEGTYIQTETNPENNTNAEYDWSYIHLDALYYFNAGQKLQPYLAAGAGEGTLERSNTDQQEETLLNIGGGLKYFFTPSLSLRGDLRAINSQDEETTAGAATVTLAWLLGGGHSSSNRQGDFDVAQTETTDSDQDSILDTDDLCPSTPPSIAVDEKGCALDLDQDGIADYRDQCANTEAGIDVDSLGCPQDLDQDGIADYKDKCLGTKQGHIIDEEGCAVRLTESISMDLNVTFPSNSATLTKEQLPDVEALATFLKRYADTVVVIEGHSDNTGDADYNRYLSQKRADEIRTILVEQFNVSQERLKAVGYGEDKPVANNGTQDGRHQNRRAVAAVNATVEKTPEQE
jgi:OOP family OmpA-OmpF porin